MKEKFIYSIVLFAGLLFAGSDFLYAQDKSGSSTQKKTYKYEKHSKSSQYGDKKGNMNEMKDSTKSFRYNEQQGQDQYKGMSDTSKYQRGMNPSDQPIHKDQKGYQHQGDYSNPGGVDKQGELENQGDYSNPGDIHDQDRIQNQGDYNDQKEFNKDDQGGYNKMNEEQEKSWNKSSDSMSNDVKKKDLRLENNKEMRLEKNSDLKKKGR